MKPITPPLPLFYARCVYCSGGGDSLTMATAGAPWTYVCFACQDDATREAVRLNSNAAIVALKDTNPTLVASARRALGIKRPRKVFYDASWAGCGSEA